MTVTVLTSYSGVRSSFEAVTLSREAVERPPNWFHFSIEKQNIDSLESFRLEQ